MSGIDWTAIERARAQLSAKPEVPAGWITARMYADRMGMTKGGACDLLKRMVDAGTMESDKHGRGLIYRPKS